MDFANCGPTNDCRKVMFPYLHQRVFRVVRGSTSKGGPLPHLLTYSFKIRRDKFWVILEGHPLWLRSHPIGGALWLDLWYLDTYT